MPDMTNMATFSAPDKPRPTNPPRYLPTGFQTRLAPLQQTSQFVLVSGCNGNCFIYGSLTVHSLFTHCSLTRQTITAGCPPCESEFIRPLTVMVSLARTFRNIRRVGFQEWWRQMQYIGDAKAGSLVGKDQYVPTY